MTMPVQVKSHFRDFGALITVIILCFRTLKNNYFGENKGCPKIYGIYGMYFRSVRDVFSNV